MIIITKAIFMFKYLLFIPAIFITATSTSAQPLETISKPEAVFNYNIIAQDNVGDLTVKILRTPQSGYSILEHTSIHAEGVWGDKSLQSTAHEHYSFEGDLIEADKKTFRQKKAYWTKIDSVGTDLWIYFSKIADHQQHAESELIGLSLAVLGNLIPQVGEVIGVSQLLLSDKKVEPISMLLAKSWYHSTLAHLPIYWSTRQKKLPTRIKLLDKKTVSVMLMNVEDKGVEFRILNGAEVSTKHYILSSKGTAPLNIWLAVNKDNIPYFFQLKGGDDDGLFTISLKP
jgi:hypothetical protein